MGDPSFNAVTGQPDDPNAATMFGLPAAQTSGPTPTGQTVFGQPAAVGGGLPQMLPPDPAPNPAMYKGAYGDTPPAAPQQPAAAPTPSGDTAFGLDPALLSGLGKSSTSSNTSTTTSRTAATPELRKSAEDSAKAAEDFQTYQADAVKAQADQQQAIVDHSAETLKAMAESQAAHDKSQSEIHAQMAATEKASQAASDEYAQKVKDFDPDRRFQGARGLLAGLAIGIGAVGAGNGGVNYAEKIIQGAIDRDIDKQKMGISAAKDKANTIGELYKKQLALLGDDRAAALATSSAAKDQMSVWMVGQSEKMKGTEQAVRWRQEADNLAQKAAAERGQVAALVAPKTSSTTNTQTTSGTANALDAYKQLLGIRQQEGAIKQQEATLRKTTEELGGKNSPQERMAEEQVNGLLKQPEFKVLDPGMLKGAIANRTIDKDTLARAAQAKTAYGNASRMLAISKELGHESDTAFSPFSDNQKVAEFKALRFAAAQAMAASNKPGAGTPTTEETNHALEQFPEISDFRSGRTQDRLYGIRDELVKSANERLSVYGLGFKPPGYRAPKSEE